MKFLTFGLLVLSAALLSEAFSIAGKFYDAKDELSKIVDELKNEAEKEIQKLESEGKTALAVGLQTIEKKIEDLEAQVEKLDASTDAGKLLIAGLEVLAKKVEEELKAEINKLSGSYYDAKDDLSKLIQSLKDKITEEITKLESEGKQALGKGLEEIEKVVLDLEGQVEKLDVSNPIEKLLISGLEELAKKAEEALEEEIKKLEGSYYDDASDLLNNLLIEGEKLKKEVEEELAKLEGEGKKELGKGIEEIEKVILDVEAQLKKLNPDSAVGKALLSVLEGVLEKAEKDLEAEVKKLTGSYYDAKDDLLKIISGLKDKITEEIQKLETEGKKALGSGLEEVEKVLLDIEGQVEKLDISNPIGKLLLSGLEELAKKAEEALEEEIKKLEGSYYDDASDLLNNLLIEGEKLKKEVEEELAKLEGEGKKELGKGIEEIEKVILDVEAQLKKLNPDSVVGKALLNVLEGVLEKAEKDLEAEVKKLTGSYYDAKDDLSKLIESLKDKITEEITKLESEGKQALGKGLEEIEKVVLDLEGQVEKLDVSNPIEKLLISGLEELAKKAEEALEEEIKKLEGSYYDDASDLLNNLLIEGEKLKKEVEEELAKLEGEGKKELGQGLEAIEKVILDVEGQLKKLNPDSAVGKTLLTVLEGLLEKAEEDLEKEVKKLEGSF